MLRDNAIGTPEKPPDVCAVSGHPIQGSYTIRYHLTGFFYVLVLAKYQAGMTDELRNQYRASLSTTTNKRGSKKS